MLVITQKRLKDLTDRTWGNLLFIIYDSAYFRRRHWATFWWVNCVPPNPPDLSDIRKFLYQLSDNETEETIIRNLIKCIFRKSKDYDGVEPFSQTTIENSHERLEEESLERIPRNYNFPRNINRDEIRDFLIFNSASYPGGRLRLAEETDLMLTDEDIKEEDIAMIKKKFQVIDDAKYSDIIPLLVQQQQNHQQEITNLQLAHEEFLDTQLNFYQQTKPELFTQFENSNPPNKTIGDLLNFLETQLQTQKEKFKQQLTNWISLITTRH